MLEHSSEHSLTVSIYTIACIYVPTKTSNTKTIKSQKLCRSHLLTYPPSPDGTRAQAGHSFLFSCIHSLTSITSHFELWIPIIDFCSFLLVLLSLHAFTFPSPSVPLFHHFFYFSISIFSLIAISLLIHIFMIHVFV